MPEIKLTDGRNQYSAILCKNRREVMLKSVKFGTGIKITRDHMTKLIMGRKLTAVK